MLLKAALNYKKKGMRKRNHFWGQKRRGGELF